MTKYIWCLHCERVHTAAGWLQHPSKIDPDTGTCPECGAEEFTDGWEWSEKQVFVIKNGYPLQPEIRKLYPMYS